MGNRREGGGEYMREGFLCEGTENKEQQRDNKEEKRK